MTFDGTILGYDPGGNGAHGIAILRYSDSRLTEIHADTLQTADQVIDKALKIDNLSAIGIDTLTCWSTGKSGWRPADRWLKEHYNSITNSIASPNSLFGSMGLNGMSTLITLRQKRPQLPITETHPKVIYYELTRKKYSYTNDHTRMSNALYNLIEGNVSFNNDHEFDAVLSAYSAFKGLIGAWSNDLHTLPPLDQERIITPCGLTNYWWPSLS